MLFMCSRLGFLSLVWGSWTSVVRCASPRWRLSCQTCTATRRTAAKPSLCSLSWSAWEAAWDTCYLHWTGAAACSPFTSGARPSASSPYSSLSSFPACSSPWPCRRNPLGATVRWFQGLHWNRGPARQRPAAVASLACAVTCSSVNPGCSKRAVCSAFWELAGLWRRPSSGATATSPGWWSSCVWLSSAAGWPSCHSCFSTQTLWEKDYMRVSQVRHREVCPDRDTTKVRYVFAQYFQIFVTNIYFMKVLLSFMWIRR